MISLIHGHCSNNNQATLACSSSTCPHPSLQCSSINCSCHNLHNQCDQPINFTTILKKIHNKKEENNKLVEQIVGWYDRMMEKVVKEKEEVLKKRDLVLERALGPIESKLLRLLEGNESEAIVSGLIYEIQENINNKHFQEKYLKQLQDIKECSQKMINNALSITLQGLTSGVCKPLMIKTLTGSTLQVFISMEQKVKYLKKLIFIEKGYREKGQRLIYAGLQMNDENPLYTYNLGGGETIHCVLNLYGE